MVAPGESKNLIFLKWTTETRQLEKRFGGINIAVCYSSLLEENWEVIDGIPVEIDGGCAIEMGEEFGL